MFWSLSTGVEIGGELAATLGRLDGEEGALPRKIRAREAVLTRYS